MIVALSGPSGVGKTTLANGLLQRCPTLKLSISHTTRPPRGQEKNGVEYYFVGPDHFARLVAEDRFAEHAQLFAHRYGTAKATLEGIEAAGHDALLDIDYQGVAQLQSHYPDAVSILLAPPSLEVLQQRLRDRHTDSAEQLAIRLAKARHELSQYRLFKYLVVNDTIEEAVDRLVAIYRAEQSKMSRNRPLLQEMLGEETAGEPAGFPP
ncbi:MAG: guanylate kinase [Bradymonadales bacterium]|nr:guanylate kinase [Bradymonadales bacterium]